MDKNPDRLLRRREVESLCGIGRSTIYNRLRRGEFPRPVSIGPQSVRWRESAIMEWLDSRPRV